MVRIREGDVRMEARSEREICRFNVAGFEDAEMEKWASKPEKARKWPSGASRREYSPANTLI